MDWGIEQSVATFPTREVKNVELFDLKKFVTEEKQKRMQENPAMRMNPGYMGMGPFGMPGTGPFGGMSSPLGGMPATYGANPRPMNPNPFGQAKPVNNNAINKIDIEAMMKDIDRKIKELEEEERRENEAKEKAKESSEEKDTKVELDIPKPSTPERKVEEDIDVPEDVLEMPKLEEPKKVESIEELFDEPDSDSKSPVVNVDKDSIVVKENVVSDDEFFDDFFEDDE